MRNLATIFFIFLQYFSLSAQDQEYYQLKIYSFHNVDQMNITDEWLSETYIPAIKDAGYKSVGVFKNRAVEGDTTLKTYVLIPTDDVTSIYEAENEMMDLYPDEQHYARVQTIFLKAFSDMPSMEPSPLQGPRKDRVYELRSYESANEKKYKNKVDMFNAGGEVKLFDELGFNAVFYAEVITGAAMPNLMYMTTHATQEARDANWKSFSDAPAWLELKSLPKYQKNVSHIDIYFLYPTEYSDY